MGTTSQVDLDLGGLVFELRTARGPRIAVYALIVLLVGVVVAGVSQGELSAVLVPVVVGVGIGLSATVHFVTSALRVRLYQHGIERKGRFGTKRIAWTDLDTYTLQLLDTNAAVAGGVGGLIGALVARRVARALGKNELVPNAVILVGKDGTKIVLGANVAGYRELLKTFIPELTDRMFPAAKRAYESGAEIQFGAKLRVQHGVGITLTGLFGRKHVLPLEQAASATLDSAALIIRRSDTNAVWQSIPAASIKNLGVFQRLVALAGKPHDDRLPMAWTT